MAATTRTSSCPTRSRPHALAGPAPRRCGEGRAPSPSVRSCATRGPRLDVDRTPIVPPSPLPAPAPHGGAGPCLTGAAGSALVRAPRARGDVGMATAEYAIATLAACGFAGLLVTLLASSQVRTLLLGIIKSALTVG